MPTLSDFNAKVSRRLRLQSADPLASTDIDAILQGPALEEFSRVRPRVLTQDLSGSGAFDYALSSLSAWAKDFSGLLSVEYPVDNTSRVIPILDPADWTAYVKVVSGAETAVLRFLAATPATGETFRVRYTARHTLDATGTTVAAHDENAFADLAAAFCMESVAAYYLNTASPSIGADAVNYRERAAEARRLARELRANFRAHVGLPREGEAPAPAASLEKDLDFGYPWGGPRLFHPPKWR